jgi:hypothetical protein
MARRGRLAAPLQRALLAALTSTAVAVLERRLRKALERRAAA